MAMQLALAVLILLTVAAAYALLVEPVRLRSPRRHVVVPNLPKAMDGLRVLHLSDLHLSSSIYPRLRKGLEALARETYDVVLVTGDLIEDPSGIGCATSYLGTLKTRYGVFAVLGNHDHLSYDPASLLGRAFGRNGAESDGRASALVPALQQQGIHVLVNQSHALRKGNDTIWLVGVDDHYTRHHDIPKALEGIPLEAPKILLSHSPDIVLEDLPCTVDLILAGHTHGGQVRLPIIGALITPSKVARNSKSSGIHTFHGYLVHISGGVGTAGIPIRFLCPPEAPVLELRTEPFSGNGRAR